MTHTPIDATAVDRHHALLRLVGTPYVRGSTDPAVGFDCFTLLEYVRREFYGRPTPTAGIPADDIPPYAAAALGIYRVLGGNEHTPGPWTTCEPVDGCAVALGRRRFGRLHHCGVLVDSHVLHALNGVGVVLTPIDRIWYLYSRVEFYECHG